MELFGKHIEPFSTKVFMPVVFHFSPLSLPELMDSVVFVSRSFLEALD